jgi:hypothetical protein
MDSVLDTMDERTTDSKRAPIVIMDIRSLAVLENVFLTGSYTFVQGVFLQK